MLRDGYPARVCDRMATGLRLQRAVYLTCAETVPHATRRDGGDFAIHTCICGHGRVTAPGARSAGGAAMCPAGAASHGVRMPLRGDAWRRGSPCGCRWPVRTARWPQSGDRTHVSSTAPHGGDLAIHTCICATAPLRPRSGDCTRRQVGRWRSAVACRSSKLRCAHAVARRLLTCDRSVRRAGCARGMWGREREADPRDDAVCADTRGLWHGGDAGSCVGRGVCAWSWCTRSVCRAGGAWDAGA